MTVALVVLEGQRRGLGGSAGKQQNIRHVFAAFARQVDLRQSVVTPAQRYQHFVDHLLLSLRFVNGRGPVQSRENALKRVVKRSKGGVGQLLMRRGLCDAARQKVLGKKLPLHGVVRVVVKRRAKALGQV